MGIKPGIEASGDVALWFKHDFDTFIFFLAENFVSVRRIRQRQSLRDNIIEPDFLTTLNQQLGSFRSPGSA